MSEMNPPLVATPSFRTRALGRGLLRPFQRDGKADFASASGEKLVHSAVGQVLGTVPGELPWRSELGSRFELLRHQKNDHVLQELARVYVVRALKRWEPRVRVTSVLVTREQDPGEKGLAIRLRYDILASPGSDVIAAGVEHTVRV